MSEEPDGPTSWTTFRIFAQIFVAFGQGSGHLIVSDDAVRAAVKDYAGRITGAGDWGGAAASVLGIARVMGQASAEHALRDGRAIITAGDYQAARAAIHGLSEEARTLLDGCPW